MDIRTLLSRVDIIENNTVSMKQYLSEGLYNTPEMQPHWRRIDEGFVQGYEKYLAEVALTPDQIQNIFKQASGGGAGAETKDPGKLAALVDKVLPASQAANLEKSLPEPNAGPVQGFEEKAGAAVQGLQGVDNSTKQSLMQWVKAGVAKPETQQLILAAVGAGLGSLISKVGPILSMIPGGGPVAAAITGAVVAGGVAVLAAKLQGKDWKTAFKGAIKPALMGGASAVIGNLATTAVSALTSGGSSGEQQPPAGEEPQQRRGAASGDMKPGDYDKMSQTPTNSDGSPMTVDQINQAKYQHAKYGAEKILPIAGQDTFPDGTPIERTGGNSSPEYMKQFGGSQPNQGGEAPEDFSGTATPDQIKAADDAIYKQAKASGATGSSSSQQFTGSGAKDQAFAQVGRTVPMQAQSDAAMAAGGDNPYAQQAKDQMALNQRMQAQADAGSSEPPAKIVPRLPPGAKLSDFSNTSGGAIGQNFDAGIAPIGANGQPMQQVPMDSPEIGQAFNAGAAPIGANGQPMQAVPMDEPAAPQGINRLTGKPLQAAPAWDQMTPDQQAATTAKQQQQAADAAAGAENAKQYWANKNPNTRGLKESFSESIYVDKQATLRMWLDQEARGLAVSGLALKPIVKEGIMDSLKGMFGGKKGAAPAAGGVTADALNKAWAAAGSPTDSEEVAKVLQSAGVPAETVGKVFTDLKLPAPGAAPTAKPEDPAAKQAPPGAPSVPTADTKAGATAPDGSEPAGQVNKNSDAAYSQAKKLVMSLSKQQQQQVMQYLQKQLGQA